MKKDSSTHQAPRTGGVRFAPSPTGRFHVGNLRTAWISYQWARSLGVPWVVRVEDIDRPRVLPGAREQQLADMEALGMKADVLLVQSLFQDHHWDLFLQGIREGRLYPCDCSRKEVQTALIGLASAPHDGLAPVYTGSCRPLGKRELRAADTIAWRFRMPEGSGKDDFIVARTGPLLDHEGFPSANTFVPSYHWACAIDDFDGCYDLLVRSADLKPAALVQRAIQTWLNDRDRETRRIPAVFHTALVVQNDGHRLEKRTKGVTLPELLLNGVSISDLIARFEASFDRSLLSATCPETESILGESIERVSLQDLGL